MSAIEIDGALIQGYIDLNLGIETAYENRNFKPSGDDGHWAKVSIVPAITEVFTMGVNGSDLHSGFMQIDLNVPENTGRGALVAYYDTFLINWPVGKVFIKNSQTVRVTSVERSAVRNVDGWSRLSVTVNWEAETIRPSI